MGVPRLGVGEALRARRTGPPARTTPPTRGAGSSAAATPRRPRSPTGRRSAESRSSSRPLASIVSGSPSPFASPPVADLVNPALPLPKSPALGVVTARPRRVVSPSQARPTLARMRQWAVVVVVDDQRGDTAAVGIGDLKALLPARSLPAVDSENRRPQPDAVRDAAAQGQPTPGLLHPLVEQHLEAVAAAAARRIARDDLGRAVAGEALVEARVGLLAGEDGEREMRVLSEPVPGERFRRRSRGRWRKWSGPCRGTGLRRGASWRRSRP